MNTNTQPSNNKIIDINNMCEILTLLNLDTIPELEVSMRTVELPEEIIADVNLESLSEAQDDVLFVLKHSLVPVTLYRNEDEAADNHKIPRKRVKTFHEHPIPEPMDICADECETSEKWMYSCCANCVLTDGQTPSQYCRRAYPDRIIESYSDDSDEEREIDEYDPQRFFRSDTEDEEDEYLTEIWILEQEAKRRFPRRIRSDGLQEIAVRLFEEEPEEELIMPELEDEYEEFIPPMPVLQRQNTQFSLNGVQVFNGNSNGSRFFDDELV
jgi:hypothetical protein